MCIRDRVLAAGKTEGERLWPFPMDEDYNDYLKSAFADLPNIGGRYGGSITASKFLENFVEKKPWVHLDIAGTAWLDDSKPYLAKGPTGPVSYTHLFGSQPIALFGLGGGRQGQGREDGQGQRRNCEDRY